MPDQPTCGEGLAARATLPTKLGELMRAVADVLEHHTRALDRSDERAQQEERAYRSLVAQHRDAAERLVAIGNEMDGYRDLRMPDHDVAVLTSPDAVEVFARAVALERELVELLDRQVNEDEKILEAMRAA